LTAKDRAVAFEEELLGWLEQARPGVPTFVLPGAPPARAGACISCGDTIQTGWRCPQCLDAVVTVLAGAP
jgi:hypothetical protein